MELLERSLSYDEIFGAAVDAGSSDYGDHDSYDDIYASDEELQLPGISEWPVRSPSGGVQEPATFDFSFSEADLLPPDDDEYWLHDPTESPMTGSTGINTPEDAAQALEQAMAKAKITISRTILVSDSPPPAEDSPPRQRNIKDSRRRSWAFMPSSRKAQQPPVHQPAQSNLKSFEPVITERVAAIDEVHGRPEQSPGLTESPPDHSEATSISPEDLALIQSLKSKPFSKVHRNSWGGGIKKSASNRPTSPPIERPKSMKSEEDSSSLRSFSTSSLPSLGRKYNKSVDVTAASSLLQKPSQVRSAKKLKTKDTSGNVWRSLDADYQKFVSKSLPLKVNLVRACLLSFLREQPSGHSFEASIGPEDLQERIRILNNWWTGLLELLEAQNFTKLTAVDHPWLFEALVEVMARKEWRYPINLMWKPSNAINANFLSPGSIANNARNLFVQNLFSQMKFVVEHMAQPTTASVIAFCGKACAYAFVFCPGAADILARLWRIPARRIKQAFDCYNLGSTSNMRQAIDRIVPYYPFCMQSLVCASASAMVLKLKSKPLLPLGMNESLWNGPWLSRWCGKDTDLFFIFVKHYYAIVSEMLPLDATEAERMCIPGQTIIQAQILNIVESNFRRKGNQTPPPITGPTPGPLDDLLDQQGMASGRSSTSSDAQKSLIEIRMFNLLREALSDRLTPFPMAKKLLIASFFDILKGFALETSIYDNVSCYLICEWLEETMLILSKSTDSTLLEFSPLDYTFWLQVFHKMVSSSNTMTEIRLYSCLFTIWPWLTQDLGWRRELIHEFLLDEEQFYTRFCHWCPIVRAYYMRLLCWRVARYDADASETKAQTLELLLHRVRYVWSHYQDHVSVAKSRNALSPSTAPGTPSPGRQLLITRTDNNPPITNNNNNNNLAPARSAANGVLASKTVDKKPSNSASEVQAKISDRNSSVGKVNFLDKIPFPVETNDEKKKKSSSLLRSLKITQPAESDGDSGPSSPLQEFSQSTLSSIPRDPTPSHSSRSSFYEVRPSLTRSPAGDTSPTLNLFSNVAGTFKFSLELISNGINQACLPIPLTLRTPNLPMAAQIMLQSRPGFVREVIAARPTKPYEQRSTTYTGRALAEWTLCVNECQNFFERRRTEGVLTNSLVETPDLGVEAFRRPG